MESKQHGDQLMSGLIRGGGGEPEATADGWTQQRPDAPGDRWRAALPCPARSGSQAGHGVIAAPAAGQGGSPGIYCRRDIINAIRCLTHNGPAWRALPADLPHWRTVYGYVHAWQASGATRRMHDELREAVRVLAGRSPAPTAAIIDSQSVKAADTIGKDSRGYDAGKKIAGRKRHLAVDVMGLILAIVVTAASVQDRDGARPLLWQRTGRSRRRHRAAVRGQSSGRWVL
jgi:transposase